MSLADEAGRRGDQGGLADFARAWAKALAGTCYVPMTRAERHDVLHSLGTRLAAAVTAEPFSRTPGYDLGTDLVVADFATPEALGRTVEVIDDRFLADGSGTSWPASAATSSSSSWRRRPGPKTRSRSPTG